MVNQTNPVSKVERPYSRTSLLAGLLGKGIRESFAPDIHMMEGEALDIRYVFRRIDLDVLGKSSADLPELLEGARTCGYNGLVITHPCKQAIIPLLKEISDTAKILQAVNTIVFRDDGIYGYNTDWSGFLAAFRAGLGHVPARHVVMLGCGGAGAAMAYAMLSHGTEKLIIHDSEAGRAQELAARLAPHFPGQSIDTTNELDAEIGRADGIINATPLGMTQYPGTPIDLSLMRPDLWALDLNYFPEETELLAAARKSGASTMNGRHMSAFQVAEQMNLFGGVSGDIGRIIGFSDSLAARRKANAGET